MVDRAESLAEEHWSYISELLGIHKTDDEMIEAIRFHYIAAFIHGYKHGVEDSKNRDIYLLDALHNAHLEPQSRTRTKVKIVKVTNGELEAG